MGDKGRSKLIEIGKKNGWESGFFEGMEFYWGFYIGFWYGYESFSAWDVW